MGDHHTYGTSHAYAGHEHVEHGRDAHHNEPSRADSVSRVRDRPRGFILKKRAGLLATGGGTFAIVHVVGGGIVHVVLPILVGLAIWQWAGGIAVGLLVVGVVLYLGVRRRLTKSDKEST